MARPAGLTLTLILILTLTLTLALNLTLAPSPAPYPHPKPNPMLTTKAMYQCLHKTFEASRLARAEPLHVELVS